MANHAIEVNDVTMIYRLPNQKYSGLKEYFIKRIKKQIKYNEFKALDGVNFFIESGEIIGIIGLNGAGKSTLLKIISGVIKPTKGSVKVKGRISPLLELGAGFDVQLTGRQNIFLNGAVLGYDKKYIQNKLFSIINFADLGEFIDIPVKNYSSGMRARLGFSIATAMDPDILIVDEVLGVGDKNFRAKSSQRMKELFDSGGTVLLVSHSIGVIKKMCNRVIWLDKGKLKMIGNTDEVVNAYENS